MKVCCTGDFHGRTPPEIPDCDLVLFAGDLGLGSGNWFTYQEWLTEMEAREIAVVGIAGNHDYNNAQFHGLPWVYLENNDATIVVRRTEPTAYIRVFGTPLSPPFNDWAHMRPEDELEKVYATIPDDIDIIVSHCPPHGYGDQVVRGARVGSEALAKRIMELPELKLVACGHIHEGYGTYGGLTELAVVVNGSWVNERYEPGNPPIMVEL